MDKQDLSPDRRREYSRLQEKLMLAGIGFALFTGALAAFSRLPGAIRRRTKISTSDRVVNVSLFAVVLSLVQWIVSLPFSFYQGYSVEKKYDLSTQTPLSWFTEQLKGLALQIVFFVPLTHLVLWVIRAFPRAWWAVLSAISIPFSVLLAQLFPVLIAPIFNTYRPLENRALADRLIAMARKSGVQVDEVYEMDMSRQTKKANAFFAGIGRTKRIVLSDTLLKEFDDNEIAVIVAHEMGHQIHGDIWRLIILGSIANMGMMVLTDRIARSILRNLPGAPDLGSAESLPLLSWVLNIISLLLTPVQSSAVRWIERRADTYALETTNDPDAFKRAMNRLSHMNLSDPEPNRILHKIFHSHPTIQERLDRADHYRNDKARSA